MTLDIDMLPTLEVRIEHDGIVHFAHVEGTWLEVSRCDEVEEIEHISIDLEDESEPDLAPDDLIGIARRACAADALNIPFDLAAPDERDITGSAIGFAIDTTEEDLSPDERERFREFCEQELEREFGVSIRVVDARDGFATGRGETLFATEFTPAFADRGADALERAADRFWRER